MDELLNRVKNLIETCWSSFSAKVGGGVIAINKEASMQLQFAYLLKNSLDLVIHNSDEEVRVELETTVEVDSRNRECDIMLKVNKGELSVELPIEMKCYKTKSSSGGYRGAQDLFRYGVYEDMELLEQYVSGNRVQGFQLSMTDSRNFPFPKSKDGKSWDYDISDGTIIRNGASINTPIGGKPASVTLNKDYEFNWVQYSDYYFLKLEGING